jgi:hypothetical protein
MGLRAVRLPIHLDFLLDENSDDLLNHEGLAYLDRALEQILSHDLAVMVEIHSTTNTGSQFSYRLETEPDFLATYAAFWKSLAAYLSDTDPEWVFLEVLNEPVFEGHTDLWPPMQAEILAAMREGAPQHTLIATGASWSNLDTLLALEPVDDPNVIYNFHFYEPFLFTHQGANWSWYGVVPIRDLPYPSDPENIQPVLKLVSDSEIQGYIRQYGAERWNLDRLDARIGLAAAWAETHGVRVICNEFGVYRRVAPRESRVQWTHDVRTLFEQYGIGWAMWDYNDSFGVVLSARVGPPTVDMPIAEALGLTIPGREG